MNNTQKSYLKHRIDEILAQHVAAINADGETEMPIPTIKELISSGKIKLNIKHLDKWLSACEADAYHFCSWRKDEDANVSAEAPLVEFMDGLKEIAQKANKDKKEREADKVRRLAEVKKYATDLKDGLILGSDSFAMAKLEEFASRVF